MRILCVAEKPSIAKSIAGILSGGQISNRPGKDKYCRNYDFQYRMPGVPGMVDMTMTSVRGHLTESEFGEAHRKWYSCSPADLFQAPIVTSLSTDGKAIGQNLRLEAQRIDAVMIWTDCDREGEHIGSEIVAEVRKVRRGVRVMRARFSAIIASQIHHACQNTVDLDWRAAEAVEARIQLDLRIGAAFTRMQTMGLQTRIPALSQEKQVISYGPCQFPTLGFVVDRYDRVISFVPETFWSLQVFKTRSMTGHDPNPNDHPNDICKVTFTWQRVHLFDKTAVEIFRDICRASPEARVTKVNSKQTKKWKPYPLTTVELQKSGSRLLRMTPKKVLDIAESLYQKGFLSYPRTETDQFDKDFDLQALVRKQTSDSSWGNLAQRLVDGDFERPRNGKNNDKAHPPIHPTAHANNLSGDDRRVYDYVTRRFLASCWKDALGTQTTVEIDIAGEKFHAAGLVILQRNYLEVYTYDKWEGNLLPPFVQGESFLPTKLEMKQGSTSPPKLLTEADLVSLMDKNGIGTDATIAEHIAKVIDRRYVMSVKEGKTTYLVPSTLGIGLVEGYNQMSLEKSLSKPLLRRETEYRMSLICAGQRTQAETVAESLEEYRSVFALASREFAVLAETVLRYLTDPNAGQEARAVQLLDRDVSDDDDGLSDENSDAGDPPPPPDGGRGARGREREADPRRDAGGASNNGRATRRPPANNDDDGDDDPDDGFGRRIAANSRTDLRSMLNTSSKPTAVPTRSSSSVLPSCSCGEPAAERTVNKEGANKGRKFFSCAKMPSDTSKCDFFEWAGASISSCSATKNVPTKRPSTGADRSEHDNDGWSTNFRSTNVTGGDGSGKKIRCECDLQAELNTVFKEGPNKGRKFWGCPRESARLRCRLFEWANDENDGNAIKNNGGGDAPGITCFKCGQTGHWASNCTSSSNQASGSKNRNKSRTTSTRGKKKKTGNSGGSSSGKGSCFQCGQSGHWSSDCPSKG